MIGVGDAVQNVYFCGILDPISEIPHLALLGIGENLRTHQVRVRRIGKSRVIKTGQLRADCGIPWFAGRDADRRADLDHVENLAC